MLEHLMKNSSPPKGPALEQFEKDYYGKFPIGTGEECGKSSPSLEGIGVSETMCDELTADPSPCHPVPLAGNM